MMFSSCKTFVLPVQVNSEKLNPSLSFLLLPLSFLLLPFYFYLFTFTFLLSLVENIRPR